MRHLSRRLPPRARWVATVALALAVGAPALADFNPRGRVKRPTPRATTPKPARPAAAPTERSPEALIQRYTVIVLNQPGAAFPLQRLARLYRERDGNLDRLIAEFEQRVQKGEGYNSLVALAGVYLEAGQRERAIEAYQKAIEQRANDPAAMLALANVHHAEGDHARAIPLLERALPLLKVAAEIEQVLRQLMTSSLEVQDYEAAQRHHERLVQRAKGSFFVRTELGRELLSRGQAERAEQEFRRVVRAAAGDNRALAPALLDLGRALAEQGKSDEALETLQRALRLTPPQSGLRREILQVTVEVYRGSERLTELVQLLEAEKPNDFQRLRMLGGLYEETGRIDEALQTYQRALSQRPEDLELRLKRVQLLQLQGQLDEAIAEYQRLVRAAPNNPDYVFRLAEALVQRGDRKQALAELQKLERRSNQDTQTLAALVDFYERLGEADRSMALLERLTQIGNHDPMHLVELGSRYYREGDNEKAKRTWKRILQVTPERARALHMLGDVYLEHDMPEEALEALEQALRLEPDNVRYAKSLALALERTGATSAPALRLKRYERARKLWEELLERPGSDHALQREARQHIVTLWSLSGTLEDRIRPLERNLKATPPNLGAGRMLAEVYFRLRRYAQAERSLRTVLQHAPGDSSSYLRLERVLVLQRKLEQAIDVLRRLVELDPKSARQYYQRMAQYAAELYDDDAAIEYASKAVALSPDDAMGHKKLGDMYRRRQDTDRAISHYRKALAKNDRLFAAYFDLAELLLGRQQAQEASQLLRRVMRSAVDDELIQRATRLSMQIHLGTDSLEELEKDLLPVALAHPHKPIYRRLLIEIYNALAFPLVQKAKNAEPEVRARAREQLRRIGRRAVKPLLDALGDEQSQQQRVAIELLTHLHNENASPALFAYATGDADAELRMRAMIAAGAPADDQLLPKLEELLTHGSQVVVDEGNPVSLAAVWAVARLSSPRAQRFKQRLLQSDSSTARALAALSLGLQGHRPAVDAIAELVRHEPNPSTRAAAILALSELDAKPHEAQLATLTSSTQSRVRAAALVALARLQSAAAKAPIAQALVAPERALRETARRAAELWVMGHVERGASPLPIPNSRITIDHLLEGLMPEPASMAVQARALVRLTPELIRSTQSAVQASPEQARLIADALTEHEGAPGFSLLLTRWDELDGPLAKEARRSTAAIAESLVPGYVHLGSHPSADVRATALRFLATREEASARRTLIAALRDRDENVQRVALIAIGKQGQPETISAVLEKLGPDTSWPMRVAAAQTLSAYRPGTSFDAARVPAYQTAVERLSLVAQQDDYALVRQAALEALARLSPTEARPVLQRLAKSDEEPRVREAAKQLITQLAEAAPPQPALESP